MGAGKGQAMVNIRNARQHEQCSSCMKKSDDVEQLYEIGIGPKGRMVVTCLCDGCMHMLLQKLIIVGSEYNEVH